MEIFKKYPELEKEFRANIKQSFAATEFAYIERFLNGDKTIKETDFSTRNLEIVKSIIKF